MGREKIMTRLLTIAFGLALAVPAWSQGNNAKPEGTPAKDVTTAKDVTAAPDGAPANEPGAGAWSFTPVSHGSRTRWPVAGRWVVSR